MAAQIAKGEAALMVLHHFDFVRQLLDADPKHPEATHRLATVHDRQGPGWVLHVVPGWLSGTRLADVCEIHNLPHVAIPCRHSLYGCPGGNPSSQHRNGTKRASLFKPARRKETLRFASASYRPGGLQTLRTQT